MDSFKTLLIDNSNPGLFTITLNRPKALNALNEEMIDELYRVTTYLKSTNEYKAVILRGAGRAFCSGGDLRSFENIYDKGKEVIEQFISKFLRFSKTWYELPIPTIACLRGAVAGGGASLALASDIRIASDTTSIQFIFSKIGLIPDMGAHYLLPKIIGEAKAMELLYFGNQITADEAFKIGLVNKVVEDTHIETEVLNYAAQFNQTSTTSNKIIKRLVKQSSQSSIDQTLNDETFYQTECFKTDEFQGYIKSFFNK